MSIIYILILYIAIYFQGELKNSQLVFINLFRGIEMFQDPILLPYSIDDRNICLPLPRSYTKSNFSARAVLTLFIESNENTINGFVITSLIINYNDEITYRYYEYHEGVIEKNRYPVEVQEFYSLLEMFIPSLVLIRDSNVEIYKNVGYIIYLPIYFE